jgi:ankyrin repeat protein
MNRAVGYELKRKYDTSEQQVDSMEFILERVLSYIPDWDEVYESDIHREAMDPEGTGEGMLKALREQPWTIDELDDHGFPAIHYAVSEGNLATLDLLIMAKANINQQCYLGLTPLIVSSIFGYERETARLLESEECRMNVNHMTPGGFGALHFAIQQNFPTIVRMLLEAGATVTYGAQHEPILHTFSYYIKGSQDAADEILHVLLMHGADLEEKDTAGVTPVMSAIIRKNILALRSLLSAGASLTAIDPNNQSIFHAMACAPDVKMIDFIGKQNLADVELEQRTTNAGSPLYTLHQVWIRPSWQINEWLPRPSLTEMEAFITFYFDLLIPDLRRHMSTIDDLLLAVKDRDVSTATGILDELIEKRVKCRQPDLAGWYRGLKGYVIDGGWEYLEEVLKEEHDETNEKIGRAAVAKGKTITDPEMEEFFLK